MALTRKFLRSIGIEDEKAEQIIEAHSETVNALKDERDTFREDAEKLESVQKELNALKEKTGGKNLYEEKYNTLKQEFDDFRNQQSAKETKAAKETAYRDLLKQAGVSEKRQTSILKISDIDDLEFDESGKLKDAEKLVETIRTEWADFIPAQKKMGADPKTPPVNNPDGITRERFEQMGYNSRLKLKNDNPELYNELNQKGE